ncbi:MAG: hypothetical protein ACXVX6_05335 [Mycobacterium sp.]
MTAPLPAAEIIAERRFGGIPAVRVMCPVCGRTHLHRQPADPATPHVGPCGAAYTIGRKSTSEKSQKFPQ